MTETKGQSWSIYLHQDPVPRQVGEYLYETYDGVANRRLYVTLTLDDGTAYLLHATEFELVEFDSAEAAAQAASSIESGHREAETIGDSSRV